MPSRTLGCTCIPRLNASALDGLFQRLSRELDGGVVVETLHDTEPALLFHCAYLLSSKRTVTLMADCETSFDKERIVEGRFFIMPLCSRSWW
jgi:hypothetical protein